MDENIKNDEVMNNEEEANAELTVYEDDLGLVEPEEESKSGSGSALKGVCTLVGAATLVVGAVAGVKKLHNKRKAKKAAKEEAIREETKKELIDEGWTPPVEDVEVVDVDDEENEEE